MIKNQLDIWATHEAFPIEIHKLANAVQQQGKQHPEYEYFTREMFFGTGGVRALIGAGSGRINFWTLARLSHAIAQVIQKQTTRNIQKTIIGYDTRYLSYEFAHSTAAIFAWYGFGVGLFARVCPIPLLSYTILQQKADLGILITASHNPKQYNGYKLFQANGAQIVSSLQKKIESVLKNLTYHNLPYVPIDIDKMTTTKTWRNNVYSIGDDVFDSYLQKILPVLIKKPVSKYEKSNSLRLVYSPLHGAGTYYVDKALKEAARHSGVKIKVFIVEEQMTNPNGAFSTVDKPNPEEKIAMDLAIQTAQKHNVKLFIATDPDVDRLGVGYLDKENKPVLLTGNQIGSIFCMYLCEKLVSQLPSQNNKQKYIFFKTIVTTDLQTKIINSYQQYGFEMRNVLTGFKYIAKEIDDLSVQEQFVLGSEESYGYLPISFIRDKDAISAAVLFMEIVKEWGDDLETILAQIHQKYGFYIEKLISIDKEGVAGQQSIAQTIEYLRIYKNKLLNQSLDSRKIVALLDFQEQLEYRILNNKIIETPIEQNPENHQKDALPKSNVLQFKLHPQGKVTIRPSGTEPKMKIYVSLKHATNIANAKELQRARLVLKQETEKVIDSFYQIMQIKK